MTLHYFKASFKVAAALLFIGAVILFFSLRVDGFFSLENISDARNFILNLSFPGIMIAIVMFPVFGLFCLPTFYFMILSGYIYGAVAGFFISWIGMSAGLLVSFINARYLFRNAFLNKFGGNKFVSMIESYSSKYGLAAVIALRLLFFIPYNLQNIAFGLSKISIVRYMTGAVIGILPVTIFYSILGDALNFEDYDPGMMKTRAIIFAVFAVFLSAVFIAGVILKSRMKKGKTQTPVDGT